jgi:hypothetical protein
MTERIEKVLSNGWHKSAYSPEEKSEFISLYKDIYGESLCSNCPGVIYNAYMKLKKFNPNQIENMSNQKYKIKKGILLDTYMSKDKDMPKGHYASTSIIPDEVGVKLFKKFPDKFEAIVEGDTVNDDKNTTGMVIDHTKMTVPALKALAAEKEYPSEEYSKLNKADLIAYLKAKEEGENPEPDAE